ncbi:type I secretion system permease/ATPase [Methyloligella sp. 2.7D]|uniref:type I secretion system permease/ATPase n=1 Tax=Methyloligella sp. 2.7D TaxID=3085160 RepID=UPI002FD8BD39
MDNQLSALLSRCREGLVAVGLISTAVNLLMLTVPIYMLQVYDRVIPGSSTETLVFLTILAAGALAAMAVLDVLRSRIMVRIGVWIDRMLSPALFERGIENTLRGVPYQTDALRDLATIRTYLGAVGIMALFDTPWMPIYLILIFVLHPILGLLATGGAVVLIGLAIANHLLTSDKLNRANMASAFGYQNAEMAFRNAEVIEAMGMTPALTRRWNEVNGDVLQLQETVSDTSGLINAWIKSLRLFLQVAVLGLGAWLVLQQELTAGGIIAASIIMSRALAPVEQAIGAWRITTNARDAWKRLTELLRLPPLYPSAMPLPPPSGSLVVSNVSYAPSQRLVLRDISFSLEPGEALGIVGPSAAGKSTLARVIIGLAKPQSGSIHLDGGDVFAWSRDNFGANIGYLPQKVELFRGTVRDNIARMEGGDPADIVAAAMGAGVHEMIMRMPYGYNTEIGENGVVLSGGQRQRIGLARAIYRHPAFVVLDEPDANLDVEGEAALGRAILTLKESGSIVVVITHRPMLAAQFDKLLALRSGRAEFFGPSHALVSHVRRRDACPTPDYPRQPMRVLK